MDFLGDTASSINLHSFVLDDPSPTSAESSGAQTEWKQSCVVMESFEMPIGPPIALTVPRRGDVAATNLFGVVAANPDSAQVSISFTPRDSQHGPGPVYETTDFLFIEGPDAACPNPPASRQSRIVNCLSDRGLHQLYRSCLAQGKLIPVRVQRANGSPNNTRWGLLGTVSKGRQEVMLPKESFAWSDVRAAFPSANEAKIQLSMLVWRYFHRDADGRCRLIPAGLDISHQAEAYHNAGLWRIEIPAAWTSDPRWAGRSVAQSVTSSEGWMVHIVNAEHHFWNEARKVCAKFGLAVRRRDNGQFIQPSDPDDTSTMCPHEQFGCPCWMPPPGRGQTQYEQLTTPQRLVRPGEAVSQPSPRRDTAAPLSGPGEGIVGIAHTHPDLQPIVQGLQSQQALAVGRFNVPGLAFPLAPASADAPAPSGVETEQPQVSIEEADDGVADDVGDETLNVPPLQPLSSNDAKDFMNGNPRE